MTAAAAPTRQRTLKDARDRGFWWMPNHLIDDDHMARMGVHAWAVYCVLVRLSNEGVDSFPSVTHLCEKTGASRHPVNKALKYLIGEGYIGRRRKGGLGIGSSEYVVQDEAAYSDDEQGEPFPLFDGLMPKIPAVAGAPRAPLVRGAHHAAGEFLGAPRAPEETQCVGARGAPVVRAAHHAVGEFLGAPRAPEETQCVGARGAPVVRAAHCTNKNTLNTSPIPFAGDAADAARTAAPPEKGRRKRDGDSGVPRDVHRRGRAAWQRMWAAAHCDAEAGWDGGHGKSLNRILLRLGVVKDAEHSLVRFEKVAAAYLADPNSYYRGHTLLTLAKPEVLDHFIYVVVAREKGQVPAGAKPAAPAAPAVTPTYSERRDAAVRQALGMPVEGGVA